MKLYFKQRFFSWFDSYDIYDEDGNTVYTVEGKLAWGHRLVIYDREGDEIGEVKQVVLTFLPRFELYMKGRLVGKLSKEFTMFKPKYDIDFNGWHVDGDFWEWEYEILSSDGTAVAVISKELFHMTDRYIIDVKREEDALQALMVVLAIDAEKCSRNNG